MDNYPHPLYFKANNLTKKEREKLWRHFQKKRDSGGGECGLIQQVGDHCYEVCFLEKEVQERVLSRKCHTISFPRGELTLTVSRTSTTDNPNTTDQRSTALERDGTRTKNEALEKVFPIDFFLLKYLKDSPKASRALHKKLSSIGCSIELKPEEEEAVVRGDIEKGPGGANNCYAERWEVQVGRLFAGQLENYLCYHVIEPDMMQILLQNPSFVTEDVRVYMELGNTVVVGEVAEVKEKIAQLEEKLPLWKQCGIPNKKYQLVEEEFNREILTNFQGVKIDKSVPNTITLVGPYKEVQSTCRKLDKVIKNIKEKTIQLPVALLNFITSSDALSSYQYRFWQSLYNPVTLEIDSNLVLFSLSTDALEEAATIMQRELCVETVQLEAAAHNIDNLKQVLTNVKIRMNQNGLIVEVIYHQEPQGSPKINVELLGWRHYVSRLKEIVMDYNVNQAETQEQLALPRPEIVDMFDEILALLGVKQTRVKITASHSPAPCVLLSGPRCLVQETLQDLRAALTLLSWKDLVLNGPGAHQYFQNEGKRSLELVQSSYHVLIVEKQGVTHNINPGMTIDCPSSRATLNTSTDRGQCMIDTPSEPSLEIKLGNLEDQQANILVVPIACNSLTSTKIGQSLLKKGGATMQTNFDLVAGRGRVSAGDVLQVDGPPSLGCSKVFFVECLPWDGTDGLSVKALREGLKTCLDLCKQQGWTSVALPVIGPGVVLKYELRQAVDILTEEIFQFVQNTSTGSVSNICVVIKPDYPDSACYHYVYANLSLKIKQVGRCQLIPPPSVRPDLSILLPACPSISPIPMFLIVGTDHKHITNAEADLNKLYKDQCSTHTFTREELASLTQEDLSDLRQVEALGMRVEPSQTSPGGLTVSGLKDRINQCMNIIIQAHLQDTLRREVRNRDEDELYGSVAWCILGAAGDWERLPKTANYRLETCDLSGGVVDGNQTSWSVDIRNMEARDQRTSRVTQLKRLDILPDFSFPLYWNNMAANEHMKKVILEPTSTEYRRVKEGFNRTATHTVLKIERLQNVHLRCGYEVLRKHISIKNRGGAGAGEKMLYHGTTNKNCHSIMDTGFSRSFSGQNATSFGHGTYFAVDASYSANYSKRGEDGSRLMFVVRVLTGSYTLGHSNMRVPPPRDPQQPNNRFDSVVNDVQNPSMFIVFHDNQAYPDYLITFK